MARNEDHRPIKTSHYDHRKRRFNSRKRDNSARFDLRHKLIAKKHTLPSCSYNHRDMTTQVNRRVNYYERDVDVPPAKNNGSLDDMANENSLSRLGLPTSFGASRRETTSRALNENSDSRSPEKIARSETEPSDRLEENAHGLALAELGLPTSFGNIQRQSTRTVKLETSPANSKAKIQSSMCSPREQNHKHNFQDTGLVELGLPTSFGCIKSKTNRNLKFEASPIIEESMIENASLQYDRNNLNNSQETALAELGLPTSFGFTGCATPRRAKLETEQRHYKNDVIRGIPPPPILTGAKSWIEQTNDSDRINEEKRKRSSTPVRSNCSPLSIATNTCSPMLVPTSIKKDILQLPSSSNDRQNLLLGQVNSDGKLSRISTAETSRQPDNCTSNERYNKKNDSQEDVKPALQRGKCSGKTSILRNERSNYNIWRKKGNSEHGYEYDGKRLYNKIQSNYRKDSSYRNRKVEINIDIVSEKSNNSSIIECEAVDWETHFKERKRQSEKEKRKDMESQRNINDRLALLAGGYLTGDGNKNDDSNQINNSKTKAPSNLVEVVVIDDDEISASADSSVLCQNLEDSQNDSAIQESNRLKDVLVSIDLADSENESVNQDTNELKEVMQSNIPDTEKESFLKKHGIRINRADNTSKETRADKDLWLIDKVAETDKALCDQEKSPDSDIIVLE